MKKRIVLPRVSRKDSAELRTDSPDHATNRARPVTAVPRVENSAMAIAQPPATGCSPRSSRSAMASRMGGNSATESDDVIAHRTGRAARRRPRCGADGPPPPGSPAPRWLRPTRFPDFAMPTVHMPAFRPASTPTVVSSTLTMRLHRINAQPPGVFEAHPGRGTACRHIAGAQHRVRLQDPAARRRHHQIHQLPRVARAGADLQSRRAAVGRSSPGNPGISSAWSASTSGSAWRETRA